MLTQISLSDNKSIKNINWDACIEATSIKNTCTRDTCASKDISAGNASFAGGISAIK